MKLQDSEKPKSPIKDIGFKRPPLKARIFSITGEEDILTTVRLGIDALFKIEAMGNKITRIQGASKVLSKSQSKKIADISYQILGVIFDLPPKLFKKRYSVDDIQELIEWVMQEVINPLNPSIPA